MSCFVRKTSTCGIMFLYDDLLASCLSLQHLRRGDSLTTHLLVLARTGSQGLLVVSDRGFFYSEQSNSLASLGTLFTTF